MKDPSENLEANQVLDLSTLIINPYQDLLKAYLQVTFNLDNESSRLYLKQLQ